MKKIVLILIMLSSLVFAYEMDYTKATECEVRHLKLYKAPKWASKIELQNGKKIFFSSPKSMFEFYFRPANWAYIGVRSEKDFKDILVTDYNTGKVIEARGAFFVYGSNITSPAGDDLVPFDSYKQAKEFAKKYNGKRVFGFKEVSEGLINWLNDDV